MGWLCKLLITLFYGVLTRRLCGSGVPALNSGLTAAGLFKKVINLFTRHISLYQNTFVFKELFPSTISWHGHLIPPSHSALFNCHYTQRWCETTGAAKRHFFLEYTDVQRLKDGEKKTAGQNEKDTATSDRNTFRWITLICTLSD